MGDVMGEAKRISDRIKLQQEKSEREISMHRRAQKAEGENSNLRAEIERLEKEVEQARESLRIAVKSADLADAAIDTAWNDAIEAAARISDPHSDRTAEKIRALKRSQE